MCKIFKLLYYQNYCSDSKQTLHSYKGKLVLFVSHPKMNLTNSRWRTTAILKIMKNCYVSATVWPIMLMCTSYDVFCATICLLGVMLISHTISCVKFPKKVGMNRNFQAKCAKYSNFFAIKTTATIQIKFSRVLRPQSASCGTGVAVLT